MTDRQDYNRKVIEEFRAKRDRGEASERQLAILTTTGAKSGQPRTVPVRAFFDGDKTYVIASKGGAPSNPDWFRNLVAHPEVTVEVGKETYKARAVVVTGAERDRLYAKAVEIEPGFGEYETKTTRKIPVVVLERQ